METVAGLDSVRERLARENTYISLFAFSASVVALIYSYLEYGRLGGNEGIFAESQTVATILVFLLIFQTTYYVFVAKRSQASEKSRFFSALNSESTYFTALAALAASCAYGISTIVRIGGSASALTAATILMVLFVIQLSYTFLSERREKLE